MKPSLSDNDRISATYAAEHARRRLSALTPSLYADVTGFARSGGRPTARAVKAWLARKGTIGAVDELVADILRHLPDARLV